MRPADVGMHCKLAGIRYHRVCDLSPPGRPTLPGVHRANVFPVVEVFAKTVR
jgi:hypothetical protein